MKNCNKCDLKTFPPCNLGIACCKCDNPDCNSRQSCPHPHNTCLAPSDTIKEDIPLTKEEKEILSAKTGYSIQSIDRIIRGYSSALPRHQRLVELYKKMVYLKKLHHEDYITDIKQL